MLAQETLLPEELRFRLKKNYEGNCVIVSGGNFIRVFLVALRKIRAHSFV